MAPATSFFWKYVPASVNASCVVIARFCFAGGSSAARRLLFAGSSAEAKLPPESESPTLKARPSVAAPVRANRQMSRHIGSRMQFMTILPLIELKFVRQRAATAFSLA